MEDIGVEPAQGSRFLGVYQKQRGLWGENTLFFV